MEGKPHWTYVNPQYLSKRLSWPEIPRWTRVAALVMRTSIPPSAQPSMRFAA
jgi:hypothetical protein